MEYREVVKIPDSARDRVILYIRHQSHNVGLCHSRRGQYTRAHLHAHVARVHIRGRNWPESNVFCLTSLPWSLSQPGVIPKIGNVTCNQHREC